MALIEIYHVVADMYDVDPNWTIDVVEGMLVSQNVTTGHIQVGNGATDRILGVAGDTQSTTTSGTPYAAQLIINGAGQQRWTENRVSDFFNETAASGRITVYNSGGKFATDQYVTTETLPYGHVLYCNTAGLFTETIPVAGATEVGTVVAPPAAWDSGVPGTDLTNGSMTLGTYLTFVLDI
jgi:hypothetical protein